MTNNAEYMRAYAKANKEKLKCYKEKYYEANKERISISGKKEREAKKLRFYVVYALPNFNNTDEVYCGFTNSTHNRIKNHKSSGKNVEGWFILDTVKTKEEALLIERRYHDNGYEGINNNYKNNKI